MNQLRLKTLRLKLPEQIQVPDVPVADVECLNGVKNWHKVLRVIT